MRIWGGADSGVQGRAPGQGQSPLKLKVFWQSYAEFLLKNFVFFEYFFHVHVLLQRGLWPYWPLHMTGTGAMAGSPPPPGSASGPSSPSPLDLTYNQRCPLEQKYDRLRTAI